MTNLNDKELRSVLIKRLNALSVRPQAILEEVRVHNGSAIADVVSVHQRPHCYEIKGQTDSISRIVKQGSFYDKAFQRVTLVTTDNHLESTARLAPSHWGVIAATYDHRKGEPVLRYIRKATNSPLFDKQIALLTLWRSELISLCAAKEARLTKMNRLELSELIAKAHTANDISSRIGEKLIVRHANKGWPITI